MLKFSVVIYYFIFFTLSVSAYAQTPPSLSSSDILLAIKKIQVLGSVLYIGAHPDDENTRLLNYLAKEKLYRTAYLSLTRGDGGQNLIGSEQGIELGLIRTQELLAARRIDGAEQLFSRAYDFGFSKSTDESLQKWNKEKVLSDVVWAIRTFQPDVIITRFPQDTRAGHGHHSASAVLGVEAFTAAADPSQFPEQLKYVKTWQAKRVLWNTYNFGGNNNTTSNEQFKIDVGGFNALLGKSYGEVAADSRSQHKSQGFGVARQRGASLEYFSTWKGEAPKNELMDGVEVSWNRVKGGQGITQKLESIIKEYSFVNPAVSVKPLVELYKMVNAVEAGYWKQQKLADIQNCIEACSGLFVDASTTEAQAVQKDSIKINFFLNNRNGNTILLKNIALNNITTIKVDTALMLNQNFSLNKTVYIDSAFPITQPYWLQHEMKEGYFEITDQQLIGQAENTPAYNAYFLITIEGQDFTIVKPVKQKYIHPVKGELYQPLAIVPPVIITTDKKLLVSTTTQDQVLRLTISAMKNITKPEIKITSAKGWQVQSVNYTAPDTLLKGQQIDVDVLLKPILKERQNDKQLIQVAVASDKQWYTTTLKTIAYDHIPTINYFSSPSIALLTLNLKTAGKKIGFIEGAGDYMPSALQQMGYTVTVLTDNDLANGNLQQYDAIITGVRAYNIKASLNTYYNKLMKYIENGGNLIVQYNTSGQIGPVKAKIAPYPFDISRTRVTDEQAIVKVLKPLHPILNFPNKIIEQDFGGWLQERSIYHAANWDVHYETLFAMHDGAEKDDEGSLITTTYGKGNFTYTGLVFFRELPAGVPGAYRLLANLIALNKK